MINRCTVCPTAAVYALTGGELFELSNSETPDLVGEAPLAAADTYSVCRHRSTKNQGRIPHEFA